MGQGKVRDWFTGFRQLLRPQASDAQELRTRILTGITVFMIAAFILLWLIFGALYLLTDFTPVILDLVISFVPLPVLAFLLFFIGRGFSKEAAALLIGFMILWIFMTGFFEGNPSDDPILILGLLLIVIFSLAILEERKVWIAIGSSGAAYAVLAVLWILGALPEQPYRVPFPSVFIIGFGWMFSALSVVIILNALMRGMKNQTEVLEQKVLDRTRNLESITAETNELNRAMLNMLEDLEESNQLLQQQKKELAAVNRELSSFSYSVSHDLRAPLRAMDGFSRILVDDYMAELSPDVVRYLGLIRRNAQQMGQLIDDLLEYSRSSRVEIRRSLTDPAAIIRQVWSELTMDMDEGDIKFSQFEMPACYADPVLLKQVYQNLLENALKYSSNQSPVIIEVGYKSVVGSESSVYYVKDNGIGFDMNYADKLFDVFQRLHSNDAYEGTGVGLAIVSRIINRHGGKVWAEAEKGKGATFYFSMEREKQSGTIG